MEKEKTILGCFVSICAPTIASEIEEKMASEQGCLFRTYIWGEQGINPFFTKLKSDKYGGDLVLDLYKFYVNPIPYLSSALKKIESFRPSEKSIGVCIIVNGENFFSKSEEERYIFLKSEIWDRILLVEKMVKRRKMDTNMELLKEDLRKILDEWKVEKHE